MNRHSIRTAAPSLDVGAFTDELEFFLFKNQEEVGLSVLNSACMLIRTESGGPTDSAILATGKQVVQELLERIARRVREKKLASSEDLFTTSEALVLDEFEGLGIRSLSEVRQYLHRTVKLVNGKAEGTTSPKATLRKEFLLPAEALRALHNPPRRELRRQKQETAAKPAATSIAKDSAHYWWQDY